MKINLIAVGKRMPSWVQDGVSTYTKRLQPDCQFNLIEISTSDMAQEGERLLAAIPKNNYIIALDEQGTQWESVKLAQELEDWRQNSYDISLLIGGADGLSPACKQRADKVWSLSTLTLPHGLVRIVVCEQLYRAFSILKLHPYHRP